VKEARLCLRTLMGERAPSPVSSSDSDSEADASPRRTSYQFASGVDTKRMRCLDV